MLAQEDWVVILSTWPTTCAGMSAPARAHALSRGALRVRSAFDAAVGAALVDVLPAVSPAGVQVAAPPDRRRDMLCKQHMVLLAMVLRVPDPSAYDSAR